MTSRFTSVRRPAFHTAQRYKSSRTDLSSSVLTSAADLFSSLRWKAADALAGSLSLDERKELLEKFNPKVVDTSSADKKKEEEVDRSKSIAEAVVEATAKEAQRQKHVWEKEKKSILEQAEIAAKARVESELAAQKYRREAFDRWQNDVGMAKVKEASASHNEERSLSTKNVESHPILGPALAEVGSKRVHLVSAKKLGNIDIWQKQRVYRHDRAKVMATDKMKTLHLGIPGVISLHEDQNGDLSVVDGQHRIGMLNILSTKGVEGIDLDQVLVEVYAQKSEHDKNHAQDIFEEINKAQPVKLVDMPGVATKKDKKSINGGVERLQERFPKMFSSSQNCRTPNVNIDNLRDSIFAADVIKTHGLNSPKAMEEWLLQQNDLLAEKYQNEKWAKTVKPSALSKATKFKFFLGLESQWLKN